ncbi:MAG: T9SS type A sorting domain-containing protein [Balneolaceae bacterium]
MSSSSLSTGSAGGLAGSSTTLIEDSFSNSEINGQEEVGGLVGRNSGEINNSYSVGSVNGNTEVGGFVGSNNNEGEIDGNYSAVVVGGDDDVGGFIGVNGADIFNNYWDSEISEFESGVGRGITDGVSGLTTGEMVNINAFHNMEDFNFQEKWLLTEDYPALHWEDVESISPPPSKVSLESPENGAENINLNMDFVWFADKWANNYTVNISATNDFSTLDIDSLLSDTVFTLQEELDYDSTYFWRVKATNESGESEWSDTLSFTTVIEKPVTVNLSEPGKNAENISTTPTLKWDPSERAESYHLELAEDSTFTEKFLETTIPDPTFAIENVLENNSRFYWRVKAQNEGGESDWSEVWNFTTQIEKPAPVQPLIPQKEEWYPIDNPYFEWTSSERADEYVFHLSKEEDFESFVLDTTFAAPDTSFTMDEYLEADEFYYWRVKAANESGESEWSEVFDFSGNGGLSTEAETLPTEYSLQQNYPNPFNPTTQIRYGIPNAAEVRLEVFNMLGQKVTTLVNERKSAGWHNATFDASELSSGFYIYHIQAGEFASTKKLMLIK